MILFAEYRIFYRIVPTLVFYYRGCMLTIGIDINGNTVRLLGLRKTKNNCRVVAAAACSANKVAVALDKVIRQAKIKIKSATIAIPYSAVMVKTISLDASLTEPEILNYLYMNSKQYTGVNPQKLRMDFNILGPTQGQPHKIDIELVAAKRDQLDAKVALVSDANIKVTAVDVDAFALARAAIPHIKHDLTAVINLNSSSFLLCVLENRKIIYIKEENIHLSIAHQLKNELQMFVTTHNKIVQQIILAGVLHPGNKASIATKTGISTMVATPYSIDPQMMLSYGLALR